MIAAVVLGGAALFLCIAAAVEIARPRSTDPTTPGGGIGSVIEVSGTSLLGAGARRLGLEARLARAGLSDLVGVPALLVTKVAGALAGACTALPAAPAAPGRLAWVVAVALPAAGFLGPDAWLERRARLRIRALRAGLADALDLLAVGAAAGRAPLTGMAELGSGDGPLARELAVIGAETSCGAPQREALDGLRGRVPIKEVAAMCGVIERSRRYGSPLAEQLREQAVALRADQRRRIEEQAARAAPKIQLAVALLLVPSVLLMIAAGLLANMERFFTGL
jgi:tight adherence protein C